MKTNKSSLLRTLTAALAAALVLFAAAAAPLAAAEETPAAEVIANAVGIDLGTTYSCVGIFRSGAIEIIPNALGNRITPSYVSWSPSGEREIGEAAKNQAAGMPLFLYPTLSTL